MNTTLLKAAAGVALLIPVLFLSSCGITRTKAPADRVVEAANERVLWDALRAAIYEEDYMVGGVGADQNERSIESAWKLDMAPFRGNGFRTRVKASYTPSEEPSESGYESFDVTIRVEKDTNQSLVRQTDPAYAKWRATADDLTTAQRIMQRLHGSLGTARIELSEKPRPLGLD